MKAISSLIFDFNGVLSVSRFYSTLEESQPELYQSINQYIFRQSPELIKLWMRGKINYQDFNAVVAERLHTEKKLLDNHLLASGRKISLNPKLLNFIQSLRQSGAKVMLLTDNMDVFSQIIIPHYNLSQYFDYIVNSADYHLLKDDNNHQLVTDTLKLSGSFFSETLLVDDSNSIIQYFQSNGGESYLYQMPVDPDRFISHFFEHYQIKKNY